MIEAVHAKLAELLGARPFDVSAAPFRQWRLRLFTMDKSCYHDVEIDADQLNMRPKALKRYVLDPALDQLNQRSQTTAERDQVRAMS